MDITNDAYESVTHYFNILKKLGYKSYNEVNKLLVLIFIEELLTGNMAEFITEEDYRNIDKALYCLYGSCLIPYPNYKEGIVPFNIKDFNEYRFTESYDFREVETLRIKS